MDLLARVLRNLLYFFLGVALAAAPMLAFAVDPIKQVESAILKMAYVSEKSGFCSAVAVAPDTAITAAHCAQGRDGNAIYLHRGPVKYRVSHWVLPNDADYAVLVVPGLNAPFSVPAKAAELESFMTVYVLGYPGGGELTTTVGYFVGRITISGEGMHYENLLAMTAAVRGGNSGGGAFIVLPNGEVRLIGVVIAGLTDGRLSFAVDVTQ